MRTQIISKLDQTELDKLLRSLQQAATISTVRRHELTLRKLIQQSGAPLIRGDEAHFFFEAMFDAPITVVGDWNNWQQADKLTRLNKHSQFYHIKKSFPYDARFAYRILIDGRDSILDPLNPIAEQEVFGTNSVVRMPAYVSEPLAEEPRPEVPRGKLRELEVNGHKGQGKRDYTRKVHAYLPAETRRLGSLPVLYVHDGTETILVGKMVNILDNLFYNEPHLQRCVVVFVPPKERDREYMLHPGYADWFVHSLVPFVETKLKLKPTPEKRGTLGASLGGLLSAQLGFLYPKVFGAIVAQSPAFWVQNEKITRMYASMRKLPLRWYLQTGVINDAEDGARNMLKILQDKCYSVRYQETASSHNWANWRNTYAGIVRWFVNNK